MQTETDLDVPRSSKYSRGGVAEKRGKTDAQVKSTRKLAVCGGNVYALHER